MKTLSITDFLPLTDIHRVIDVRTPAEYEQGHIPGAYNIPLFSNEERAIIGTTYKHVGKEAAVKQGLGFVGPRMTELLEQAEAVAKGRQVLMHCWRGGMRSASVAWLLETAGTRTITLQEGYKAYRRHVLGFFEQQLPILLLGGKTGSGKTEILAELEALGEQVVDLEALAHHRGSAFGGLGMAPQPTSEQFQNNLERAMSRLDLSRRIWLENESSYIGKVGLPEGLWKQMVTAPMISVEVPVEIRVQRLIREYGAQDHKGLEDSILRIEKRMGPQHMKSALEALDSGNAALTAEILLGYYDRSYVYLAERRAETIRGVVEMDADDPKTAAQRLIQMADTFVELKQ